MRGSRTIAIISRFDIVGGAPVIPSDVFRIVATPTDYEEWKGATSFMTADTVSLLLSAWKCASSCGHVQLDSSAPLEGGELVDHSCGADCTWSLNERCASLSLGCTLCTP